MNFNMPRLKAITTDFLIIIPMTTSTGETIVQVLFK